jgi:nitroreductase
VSELYSAVRGLRASRNFKPEPLSTEHLELVLEAARWTGSSKNNQDWLFVVVDDSAGAALLASAGSFTRPIENAAATIALVKLEGGNDFDIGRAAQNIMLAAEALGIGSCPITLHNTERSAEVLGLSDGQEAHYAVALGYVDTAAEEAERRERRSGSWGGRRQDATSRLET